jgi:hypothetical protein
MDDGDGERIWLHETIDIIGANRAAYNHHMTANFGATARTERGLLNIGVFSTVGSTERWPQTMNLWEFTGSWAGVARNFRHEFSRPSHQDTSLEPWWAEAASLRSGGYDRLLVAAPWSPSLEDLLTERRDAGQPAECHYHELVTLEPGSAASFLDLVRTYRLPLAERFGWSLLGALRTAMVNDSEAVLVWTVPTWEQWAAWEAVQSTGLDADVDQWRQATAHLVRHWRSKLMVASELSAVATGTLL